MDFLNIFSINNFFFFLILIAVFLLSYKYGRKISICLILAVYPTTLIFRNLAFLNTESNTTAVIMLSIIYVVAFYALWVNLHPGSSYNRTRKALEFALLSICFMILLSGTMATALPVIGSFLELGSLSGWLNSYISYGFALVIPIVAILLTSKKRGY